MTRGEPMRRRFQRRFRGAALACVLACLLAMATPAAASAGWGPPEPVESNINRIALAPGGTGFAIGFPATSPARLRFALRPFGGPLGSPEEFPSGIGRHTIPTMAFDASGDAVILDEEIQTVAWRSANGQTSPPQKLEGHLLARWPRLVSVAPGGAALIGVNEARPGGSPVQLAFRPAGEGSLVDTENTVDLTTNGTLIGLQLQADGGAIAVYIDEVTDKLMQVVRRSGQQAFDAPTEIAAPPGTASVSELAFSGDPSGWAMLTASGKSSGGSRSNQVLGDVRAPDGSFPTPTLVATGANISNVTPAVTASGDGMVTWEDTGLGNPLCPSFAIRGATQHLGAWSAAMAVGPDAWPDSSIAATAATSFSSGNDISVPMIRVHAEGSPCPTSPQTRSLIVRHYRAGATGITDQGFTELTPLSSTALQEIEGWAMEPAGRIFAWYRVGEERFLRTFDGVTPGPGGTLTPGEIGGGGGSGSGGTGSGSTGPTVTGTSSKGTPAAVIPPLVLQQFAIVPTIDPASLEFEMHCPPVGEESCQGRAFFMYLLSGKQIKPADASASAVEKKHLAVIATGQVKVKAGGHAQIKMRPNQLGKSLLRSGKKLKITLKLAVTQGQRSLTGSLPATIKARRGR
jgi:hypothetical protein